jgi:hypothetical protein
LQETGADVEQAARGRSLVVADFLEPMRATAAEAARRLEMEDDPGAEDAEPPPAFAGGAGSPRALLALLVTQGLLLAEEADPLRRAYYCYDLADQLALASLLASARGDRDRAARLGRHLSEVVDQGAGANLARLRQESPQDPRLRDLEEVIRRARRTVDALDKSLPPRAIEARVTLPPDDPRYDQAKDLEKSLKELQKALKEITKEKQGPPPHAKGGSKFKEVEGVVRSADAAKGLLVLSVKEKGRESELTLPVSPDVKITGGSNAVTIADLKPGTRVEVKVRDGTAAEIRFDGKAKD